MIKVINGIGDPVNLPLLDQMFRLRKKVFADRLGWEVKVIGDYEIDEYDRMSPLYVVSVDASEKTVLGSLRLLPTTGPNMLADVFSDILGPDGQVRSPTIWESSRYCVDTEMAGSTGEHGLSYVTGELLLALCEIGMEAGLGFIVTVVDLRMERILRRLNCAGDRIGEPKRFGKVVATAGLWETNEAMLEQLRQSTGITKSVLSPEVPEMLAKVA